ncbi:MAG: fibronectin type III domain-containing protein [Marinicellaceae bacterium]
MKPLLIKIIILTCFVSQVKAEVPKVEKDALVAFYNSTNGASWTNQNNNWLTGDPCLNNWEGITCNQTNDSVIQIFFGSNNINGPLPAEIGDLSNLELIEINFNQLSGTIPSEIGNLSNLKDLRLVDNQLSGSIPSSIGNLSDLQILLLARNELTGPIPSSIGNLSNILILQLYTNQLEGAIPAELGNLSNAIEILLDFNQLSGDIPSELGGLSSINNLFLRDNQLTGQIPIELFELDELRNFYIENNQLEGNVPQEIGSATQLEQFQIHGNKFSGMVPSSFTNLNNLNLLNMDYNALYSNDSGVNNFIDSRCFCDWQVTQTIAPTNVNIVSVTDDTVTLNWDIVANTNEPGRYRVLFSTSSTGPYILGGNTSSKNENSLTINGLNSSTEYYFVVQTQTDSNMNNSNLVLSDFSQEVTATTLIGDVSSAEKQALVALYNLTDGKNWINGDNWLVGDPCMNNWNGISCMGDKVTAINLSSNNLAGQLPIDLGNLTNLNSLNASNNSIDGVIPTSVGNLLLLDRLDISQNQIAGNLPVELGQLSNLTNLNLSFNSLDGMLPSEIGHLTQLTQLNLANNNLTGSIPVEFGQLINLEFLFLNTNQLSDSIPINIANLTQLKSLWLAENQLSGPIPSEIGLLVDLFEVVLFDNQFTGSIPTEFSNLVQLNTLDLFENNLTGDIPLFLSQLSNLQYLNLSSNQLSGNIPVELSMLTSLLSLQLSNNKLEGNIPPEISLLPIIEIIDLSSNQLVGEIPDSLSIMTSLIQMNVLDNALYTFNQMTEDYINDLCLCDWTNNQTLVAENLNIDGASIDSITLSWDYQTIYSQRLGGYRILMSTDVNGPFNLIHETINKTVTSYTVGNLQPNLEYFFKMQTFASPYLGNQNKVISTDSQAVNGITPITSDMADLIVEVNQETDNILFTKSTDGIFDTHISYKIIIGNNGPDDVLNARFRHVFPAGINNVTWSCTNANGGALCPDSIIRTENVDLLLDLPINSRIEFTFNANRNEPGSGSLIIVPTLSPPNGVSDPDLESNSEDLNFDILFKDSFDN